jgi:serine kinase of HPr protein (carbohydrate metabolism regulator)
MQRVHATTVAIAGLGVLIRGPSGAGKSDLALRLIDAGADLVADDYTELQAEGENLLASPPASIAGRLEARGVGILTLPYRTDIPVGLCVDLAPAALLERLPEPDWIDMMGIRLPRLALDGTAPSAPAKLRLALRGLPGLANPTDGAKAP